MFLGVPVLHRYDLLERLLVSVEATHKPDGYLIVDNGGEFRSKLESSPVVQRALSTEAIFRVLEPGENVGVAAAWNAILEEAKDECVVISNDDVEFRKTTFADLDAAIDVMHPLVIADGGPDKNGWCLFAQHPVLWKMIGPYDESFHPAYYEDSDYRWRMKLEGIEPTLVKTEFQHQGYGSKSEATNKIMRRSLEQFERKWGGDPRGDESLLFRTPFDGAPIAYAFRKRTWRGAWRTLERKIMRWDVINEVARRIDAIRYLEIGIGSGETLRNVTDVGEKTGVDPSPSVGGPEACDVFYKIPSDKFFELHSVNVDVTFVDGLHHAEQAYRDIINACAVSKVVVVHDANPTSEAMQRVPQVQGEWTGDVWKAIARVRSEGRHAVRTVDADYGVAVFVPNQRDAELSLPSYISFETYADLVANRKELLGLVSFDECMAWLGRALE